MKFTLPQVFDNANMLKRVVLDWDDTVNATFLPLRKAVAAKGYPLPAEHVYLTTENTNGGLDVVLAEGEFMRVRETRLGDMKLTQLIQRLQEAGVDVGICTHRGFHKDAMALSEDAFGTLGWRPNFIYILDPANDPDKVAFLTELYGDDFTLVDDRPRWDSKHPLPGNVWLMDQPWNHDIPVADPFCRIEGLDQLAAKLHVVYNELTSPKVVYEMQGRWTLDDELRLARWLRWLPNDPTPVMDKLRNMLASQNLTPSMLASAREATSDIRKDAAMSASHRAELQALRLLNNLHIVPISISDDSEWVSICGDGEVSIRQEGVFRRRVATPPESKAYYQLGVMTAVLAPNGYATRWTISSEEVQWSEPTDGLSYTRPMTPPSAYNNTGTSLDSQGTALTWAENRRFELFLTLVQSGKDPVTSAPLPEQILRVVAAVGNEPTAPQILAVMQLIAHWEAERGEHKTWKTLILHYGILYPNSIKEIEKWLTPNGADLNEPARVVHFIQLRAGAYLVNTEEGHTAAVAEWAAGQWMKPRRIAEQERVYPALVTLFATSATSYRSISIPLGEITRAISVVGLN